ncbi:MAG: UPF0182 family protein [Verrucomicrobia bacterium]|nr:UPF0182 family protein [Verrucomicrobiota bacterium]MCH8512242.1 UPF0182 family protein [Kiritimatiellia bacterium]
MSRPLKLFLVLVFSLLALGVLFVAINFLFLEFFVDVYWYRSLGYLRLLLLKTTYKYMILIGVTAFFFLVMFLNFWVASRYLGVNMRNQGAEPESRTGRVIRSFRHGSMKVYIPLSLVFGILLALPLYHQWESALLFFFAPAKGVQDTLFNLDISYYLFSLPIFNLLQGRLILTLILLSASLAILYAAEMRVLQREGQALYLGAKIHLSVIVFLIFLVQSWGYVLEAHMLQYSTNNEPLFFGPGFVEIYVNLPLIWASGILFLLLAVSLIVYVHMRKGLVAVIVFSVLALLTHAIRDWSFINNTVNNVLVKPSELERQRPHMQSSINATLAAYNLTEVERRPYSQLQEDENVPELGQRTDLANIPLWDYELLADVFHQEQVIRPYYGFSDVDAARYMVLGQLHQVYLAGREIHSEKLPEGAQNWISRHLRYTHGHGAVMIPAAQRGEAPMEWYLQNMPMESRVGFHVGKPSIYYGTAQYFYAIAPSREEEFHHPGTEEEVMIDYTGRGGVPVSGLFKRALFAMYFRERNILLTPRIQRNSRILFRRNIVERIEKLTPFLKLDRDPYLVVGPDRMYWIQDAYTTSNWYPNSDVYGDEDFNYIRNSIKIVVDAYDGTVDYYLFEPNDPVALAYQRMYPGLIKDKSEMPDFLLEQVRYPRDLFDIQMHMYSVYHQINPSTFFMEEDRMQFAEIRHRDTLIRMEPYYLTLDLIDFNKPEFFLITPMLPYERENLRALALAGSDGENYGRIIVYTFPKGSQFYGPAQINALIDQDTIIAERMTLWNQQGTEVKRGKMIVLPLGKHILYIQPLYMEATGGLRIPQLKRVIVSADQMVVMAETLEEAIDRLQIALDLQKHRPTMPGDPRLGEDVTTP